MKHALRADSSALMCVVMLAAVGALAAMTVLAAATAMVVAVMAGGAWAAGAGIVVSAILVILGVGLLRARRRRREPLVGVLVTSDEHPLLWVEICRITEGLGIRSPDEVSLVPDALVGACEHGTWLGLRPGVRTLRLGVPLLAGLTERQLRAVVTQELSRHWGPATLGRIIHRGKEVFGRVVDLLGEDSRVARTLRRYGGVVTAVCGPVSAGHELEADRLSAELAGNDATSASLRELTVLSRGWDEFVSGYTEPAAAVGRRPHDVFAGFTSFLKDPDRATQLAQEARAAASQQLTAHGSALSLADRLAAIASLPDDGMHDRSGPAIELLRDPDRVICRVEDSMYRKSGFLSGTWEDIVPEVGRAAAYQDALQLARLGQEGGLGPTLSVAALLEIINLRLAEEMVRPMLAAPASQEAERQVAGRLVTGFLATAAIESGTARYRFSWAGRVLVDDRGEVDNLPRLVDIALASQGAVPSLEQWLESHRVSQDLELGPGVGQSVRQGLPGAPPQGPPHRPDDDPLDGLGPLLVPVARAASS